MDLGRELNSFIFLSSDIINIDYSTKRVIYLIHCPKNPYQYSRTKKGDNIIP